MFQEDWEENEVKGNEKKESEQQNSWQWEKQANSKWTINIMQSLTFIFKNHNIKAFAMTDLTITRF